MTRVIITACLVASAALLATLVEIVGDARRPVMVCAKPWMSREDERQACAIEAAMAAHAAGRVRPTRELRTGWVRK